MMRLVTRTAAIAAAVMGGMMACGGSDDALIESRSGGRRPDRPRGTQPDRPVSTPPSGYHDAGGRYGEGEGSAIDAGPAIDASLVCPGGELSAPIGSPACHACLEQSCCAELKACASKDTPGPDDCNALIACLDACKGNSACNAACAAVASEQSKVAYEEIAVCAIDGCATACQ